MGEQIVVYGYILGVANWVCPVARRRNVDTLAALPESDWLTNSMFGLSGPDIGHGTYHNDLIHFGWTMKDGADVLPEWLARLCALFKVLYWYEAEVHFETLYGGGEYRFRWKAKHPLWVATEDDPDPSREWTFDDCGNWPPRWLTCERQKLTSE